MIGSNFNRLTYNEMYLLKKFQSHFVFKCRLDGYKTVIKRLNYCKSCFLEKRKVNKHRKVFNIYCYKICFRISFKRL